MFNLIGELSSKHWGPLRLLTSHFFLAVLGAFCGALLVWRVMPLLWRFLPRDRGRAHAVDAAASVGKPLGAGVILIGLFVLSVLLFVPYDFKIYGVLPLLAIASLVGFVDDRSGGLSELTLGLSDLALATAAALLLFGFQPATIWLPFTSQTLALPAWLNLPIVIGLIWISINAMNCNDGVDGLSGTLAAISVGAMGVLLYTVLGNVRQSAYLLVPFNSHGAEWALTCAIMCGCLFGYLWHNAPPSAVLMGDAGSRPIGLFLGILIAVSKNPFLIIFLGFTLLANGATGLAKVALLRFFSIRVFSDIRFPLHDHMRKKLNWSNTQVLARFTLLHLAITALSIAVLLKVR
jgi:phospho-N-acetylmuramoyl-pentapeptide-transferase